MEYILILCGISMLQYPKCHEGTSFETKTACEQAAKVIGNNVFCLEKKK